MKTGAVHSVVLNGLVEGGPAGALGILALPFAVGAVWVRSARHLWSVPWHHLWCLPAVITLFVAAQATPSFYFHAGWLVVGATLGSAAGMAASPAIKLRRGPRLLAMGPDTV
jgi:hypothetical protein